MHFAVLVIGDDPEDMLEPYSVYANEYEHEEYNSSGEYDWYEIGGRWNGFLKLKNGKTTNSALNKDIDWLGQVDACMKQLGEDWDKVAKVLGTDVSGKITWKGILYDEAMELLDDRRAASVTYREQEIVEAFSNIPLQIYNSPQAFLCTRDEYVEKFKYQYIITYAVLNYDGWQDSTTESFSLGDEDAAIVDWDSTFYDRFIKDLHPDERVTIVDCHI